jgi:hypothetical protein
MEIDKDDDLDCDELTDYTTKDGIDIASGRRFMNALTAYHLYAEAKQLTEEERDFTMELMTQAILLGEVSRRNQVAKLNSKRATNGRRLIGAASRAKVAKVAESFMHLSKEKAASAMSNSVNLDTGTIRRYLSELFPGDKWKQ